MNILRPSSLHAILGQKKVKESLSISIKSAKVRNDVLGHALFYGPPGTGKTTLATAISNEMNTSIQIANGANLRTIKSIVPYIMRINRGSVLFVDEIHRMTRIVEEFIYPVMEDFSLDMSVESKSVEGETISMKIPRFTLLGATTEFGSLSKPLLDRFKHKYTLSLYNNKELLSIVQTNAEKINLPMSPEALDLAVRVSRGTPRIANTTLEWLRDYLIAGNLQRLSENDVESAMAMRGVDRLGMTEMDREYLDILKNQKSPIGIETLISLSGFDKATIEGIIEPWLLREKKIVKTPKGRVAV